jgi:asparagine synthetase B (glutamine-hydrolysing)
VERYWQLSFAPREEPIGDEEEIVDELIARLKPAVARRLSPTCRSDFF